MLRYYLEVKCCEDQRQALRDLYQRLNVRHPRLLLKLLREIDADDDSSWEGDSEQEHVDVELL